MFFKILIIKFRNHSFDRSRSTERIGKPIVFINIFLIFFYHFNMLISKIIFKK